MMQYRRILRLCAVVCVLALPACGGGGGSSTPAPAAVVTPPPAPPPAKPPTSNSTASPYVIDDETEAATFLAQATFGASQAEIDAAVGQDRVDWLKAQFAASPTLYLPTLKDRIDNGETLAKSAHTDLFWNAAIANNDQLRQRMVFALSQIVVVSESQLHYGPASMAQYMDVLSRGAFGNYRDVLEEVTYTPAMAEFLTYLRNRKADSNTGRQPDENYAREIMQLFTIGLVELQQNGEPRLGSNGMPINTYTNDDVVGLSHVFTGLALQGSGFYATDITPESVYSRLVIYPEYHSADAKQFLGITIPAGTGAAASIDRALDTLVAHQNSAPFISRQLIQRFTQSDPSPAYVQRVAQAFAAGRFTTETGVTFGAGRRGDLKATIAAILLDEDAMDRGNDAETVGKVREPILRFLHWARAFNVYPVTAENEKSLVDTSNPSNALGQHPFRAASVFNFYRPGYVAPKTETGDDGLTVPEFQVSHEGSRVGYVNFMAWYVMDKTAVKTAGTTSFTPDYEYEKSLADVPADLVDHLDELLTFNRMSDDTKELIIDVVDDMPLGTGSTRDNDLFERVGVAILMTVTAPEFSVMY
ncbi:DUF1800 family protein [Parvularcula sp. LCG005]|uniref:DUF1800 domain-containing protein n=1 Tax=Parvularcula sp. LCG005 TaxID=3078805 RepID=UPI002941EDDC|nr:DUF1800 family protein [Parvularcula sp. LCG005]WOI52623.1 DUF1800 family protein [Parvularcula sp. LCG005]